ncbi:type VII secretion target [Nocardia sp. NPDC051052]|uniref:type VII secretion target n=1 Tax=Nocardia sp. NPDC051052 TaxID=3364322 RepID=UPI0037AB76F1
MNVLHVQPETFRHYGDISAAMAATVALVGAADQAAGVAAVVPVFGLIGQEFLASFAYAQANHLGSVTELAEIFSTTAANSHTAAAAYEQADQHSADTFVVPSVAE